jgi:hypothetical protein
VAFTHQVGDGLHSAIIKATRPADATSTTAVATATRRQLPMVEQSGCCCLTGQRPDETFPLVRAPGRPTS